jgi:chromatin segregation and condensation protein Rec8/ScpA/Scc1 (kleisin family)
VAGLKLQGYQGSLVDLATHLRRHRLDPLAISAVELVRQLRAHWQVAGPPGLDEVADELPIAAWVVRRKGARLIPGNEDPPEPELPPEEAPWAGLEPLSAWLQHRQAAAYAQGGVPRWPLPPPAEVPDATPWRLRWAWPPGRIRKPRAAPEVLVRSDPLWRRGLYVAHWLRRRPGGGRFDELTEGMGRSEQVDVFLVLLSLWARRRVQMMQPGAYAPLVIRAASGEKGEATGG